MDYELLRQEILAARNEEDVRYVHSIYTMYKCADLCCITDCIKAHEMLRSILHPKLLHHRSLEQFSCSMRPNPDPFFYDIIAVEFTWKLESMENPNTDPTGTQGLQVPNFIEALRQQNKRWREYLHNRVKMLTDFFSLPFQHRCLVSDAKFLQIDIRVEAFWDRIFEFLVNKPFIYRSLISNTIHLYLQSVQVTRVNK